MNSVVHDEVFAKHVEERYALLPSRYACLNTVSPKAFTNSSSRSTHPSITFRLLTDHTISMIEGKITDSAHNPRPRTF